MKLASPLNISFSILGLLGLAMVLDAVRLGAFAQTGCSYQNAYPAYNQMAPCNDFGSIGCVGGNGNQVGCPTWNQYDTFQDYPQTCTGNEYPSFCTAQLANCCLHYPCTYNMATGACTAGNTDGWRQSQKLVTQCCVGHSGCS